MAGEKTIITKGISETRTFGSEFELTIMSRVDAWETGIAANYDRSLSGLGRFLRDSGVNIRTTYSHGSSDQANAGQWTIEVDGSLGCRLPGEVDTAELITPVLCGTYGVMEVKRVLDLVKRFGCSANRSCGNHIHLMADDLNRNQMRIFYELYRRFQPTIDTFMPPSRRNNAYCKQLEHSWPELEARWNRYTAHSGCPDTLQRFIDRMFDSRYVVVNFRKYASVGTVEFRQPAGTVEFDKWLAMLCFAQGILEGARGYSVLPKFKNWDLQDLFKVMSFTPSVYGDIKNVPSNEFKLAKRTLEARVQKFARRTA